MIPDLLELAHAVEWDGQTVLVMVGFDRLGMPQSVRVAGDCPVLARAAIEVENWLHGREVAVVTGFAALIKATADVAEQASPIVRAAFSAAEERLALEAAHA